MSVDKSVSVSDGADSANPTSSGAAHGQAGRLQSLDLSEPDMTWLQPTCIWSTPPESPYAAARKRSSCLSQMMIWFQLLKVRVTRSPDEFDDFF